MRISEGVFFNIFFGRRYNFVRLVGNVVLKWLLGIR